ncbi:hypothetical protein [Maritimibacter alkaliphilus]|uniref:hypothetical protein n=1 Tax=Maritimibacter alkaliphilus TaxID=404236 RepID=UPI001C979990|nr:hypothetical protein [Maritimibacter alkaliphilus]MBY6091077.1 hypothetical protein [Maritimibacter alkaliphilus]
MKFTLAKSIRYWWPVTVRMPDPNTPGKIIEQQLKVLFEPKGRDEAIAAQDAYAALGSVRERADHEHAELRDVVKGWDDVVDEDRNPVPFTEEAIQAALQLSWFRTGVYNAYADSLAGQEARLGN